MPQLLPLGQVNHWRSVQRRVIGRNTADPARWKRYRGGTAGTCGSTPRATASFRRMTELAGNMTSPMWIGGRVCTSCRTPKASAICTRAGPTAATCAATPTTTTTTPATRRPTAGASSISAARTSGCSTRRPTQRAPDVRVPSHRTQAARKFVPAAEHLGPFHVHPAGHSLAVEARGKLFTFALWEGAVRQHGVPTACATGTGSGWTTARRWSPSATHRARSASWCFDGRARARCLGHRPRRRDARRAAGPPVALANHRNEVLIGDVDSGALQASRSQRLRAAAKISPGRPTAPGSPTRSGPARGTARSSCTTLATQTSTLVTQPEFRDFARRSIPAAGTCTSCRCARSTRSTTASSSS